MRVISKNYFLLLIIFILPTIFNCTKNPVGVTQYNWYPLAVGNTWEYSRFYAAINIQSDTACPLPLAETLFSTGKVEVTKVDTLLDSIPVFELLKTIKDSLQSYSGLEYYNNLYDGLYYYAYSYPIFLPPLQDSYGKLLYFEGKNFTSIREIILWLENISFVSSSESDTSYYLPPRKSIQYPLQIGSQWTYSNDVDFGRIDKKVISYEIVQVPAGNFGCYKIQWLYDLNNDDNWESDIEIFDYVHSLVNSIGVVKRSILLKNIDFTDYCYGHKATFDVIEKVQLTAFKLY